MPNGIDGLKQAAYPVIVGLMMLLLSSGELRAGQAKPELAAEIRIGAEHDSLLTVEELDRSRNASDELLTFDLELGYKKSLDDKIDLRGGYNFSQSLHKDFDEFNIQTHLLSTGIGYQTDKQSSLRLNYYFAKSALDGSGFLSLNRLSPSVNYRLSSTVMLRATYNYSDKSFDRNPGRDADAHDIGGEALYFIDGARHYVSIAYRFRQEDSDSAAFDYDSRRLKLKWIRRLALLEQFARNGTKLRLSGSLESRNYDDATSAPDGARDDDRLKLSADLDFRLTASNTLSVHYEYSHFDSNLDSVNYTQSVLAIRYSHEFF